MNDPSGSGSSGEPRALDDASLRGGCGHCDTGRKLWSTAARRHGRGNYVVIKHLAGDDGEKATRRSCVADLLRSMWRHFHQYTALSFLFSGIVFIAVRNRLNRAPQTKRRTDSVFEIEIAFAELTRRMKKAESKGEEVSRVRPISSFATCSLTPADTHRAEFCIDKLYSPDSPTGRLWPPRELRALEMPPHARMSLVQPLLLRSLVAMFWNKPFAPHRLTRWGTELHDRFMLPFWVWQDFEDVITDLNDAGFGFEKEWFAPHFEFRFPKIGEVEVHAMTVAPGPRWSRGTAWARRAWLGFSALPTASPSGGPEGPGLGEGMECRPSSSTCNGVAVLAWRTAPGGRKVARVAGVRYRA